ncbi:unnamed protein product [Chironomus riparius]|uniref:PAP-associated domain-containing protein n=1 Tax=Chironomus riparius TaxID=315576 RepID=A0A9N9WX71_9DIPT|nr:unnamed protein product [Chironomus riparius]
MHTEITKTTSETKLTITSDPGDKNHSNMQQDKQIDEKNYDRKKRLSSNDGKDYQNTSPRRNNSNNNNNNNNMNRYSNNRIPSYNGNRQNRNGPPQQQQQQQQQFINNNSKPRLDTNNNNSNKYDKMQHSNYNSYNAKVPTPATNNNSNNNNNNNAIKSDNYQEMSANNNQVKKPIPKHRMAKSTINASPNYDDYSTNKTVRVDTQLSKGDKNVSDDSGIHLNTSVSTTKNSDTRLKYDQLMAGDNEIINRKYSMDFLQHIGHQFKNISAIQNKTPQKQPQQQQKVLDDNNVIALKMAFGDNSGYYNHLYSGAMYTNQLFFQQQQQYQSYARYQNQHMQQRVRVYPRQDNTNYQRVYQQQDPQLNCVQQPPQNSYHNAYYPQQQQQQQPQHNSFQYQNHRAKQNRDQSRKNRQNGNNNNANSTNDRNNFNNNSNSNNKKLSDQQNARLSHSKSDSAQYEENKRKNLMYVRTNSEDYRSLSPTPPSSVKSTSPGIQETNKNCDTKETMTSDMIDDSASTTSSHSAMSSSSGSKELPITPTILLTPTYTDNEMTSNKENNVNSWINNTNFTPINNVLSASAEQLNVRHVETPITIIKRPPSVNGITTTPTHPIPRNFTLPTYDPTYPFEYYYARGERCEMREEPINLGCGSIWDHVSFEIWNKFQLYQQTRETYRSKMILWRDLYEYIKGFPLFQQRACPKWGLFLVGSTISGFGLNSSDVDMCLVLKSAPQLDARTEAMITLSALKNYLSDSPFQGFSLINAKVPILRFRDATNTIEVDLNYNNCIGVRNTHLLYCYAQLDWRLRPLAIVVKLWAQHHNINDARNSTISSYSLVLMVIHFLQSAISPPVLPCLHQKYPEKFQTLHDITTIDMMERLDTDWRSENYQSLGELFLRFLDYYSNFDYSRNAISIRTGGTLSIEECRNVKTPKNDPNHWQTLCIEEPFDLTNTARSAYDGEIFEKIKSVFFQSWCLLREYKTLDSLFQEQLFVQQTLQQQMLNDIKYIVYAPNPTLNSSPLITTNQMNSEIAS